MSIHEKINIKSFYNYAHPVIMRNYEAFAFLTLHGYWCNTLPFSKWMQDQIDNKKKPYGRLTI